MTRYEENSVRVVINSTDDGFLVQMGLFEHNPRKCWSKGESTNLIEWCVVHVTDEQVALELKDRALNRDLSVWKDK